MLLEQGFHDVRVFHFWMPHGAQLGSVSNGTPLVGCKIIRRVCRRYRGLVVVGLLCVSSQAAARGPSCPGRSSNGCVWGRKCDTQRCGDNGHDFALSGAVATGVYGGPQRPLASFARPQRSAHNAPPTPAELRTCAAIIHRYSPCYSLLAQSPCRMLETPSLVVMYSADRSWDRLHFSPFFRLFQVSWERRMSLRNQHDPILHTQAAQQRLPNAKTEPILSSEWKTPVV